MTDLAELWWLAAFLAIALIAAGFTVLFGAGRAARTAQIVLAVLAIIAGFVAIAGMAMYFARDHCCR